VTFGSLFSGVGGMDLGLERAGLRCVWQCESDPFARRVLARHWPGIPCYEDVRGLDGRSIERPDLVCGGDPCQANSKARGARPARDEGPAVHFLRLVDELRPRLVLRENPWPSLRSAPWPWHRFRSGLESLGYAVLPFRLRSCCLGADHQRDRLFLLAALPDAPGAGLEGCDDRALECDDAPRRDRRRPAPRICRRVDRISHRVDRLRCLGNAVDPRVAERIGRLILAADHGS
jgi:DNA (cytosine-5)-methyltransferase 1